MGKNDEGCCQFSSLCLVEKNGIHHCAQHSMGTDIAGTGYKRDLTRTPNSQSVGTGQAPITLEWKNTSAKIKQKQYV